MGSEISLTSGQSREMVSPVLSGYPLGRALSRAMVSVQPETDEDESDVLEDDLFLGIPMIEDSDSSPSSAAGSSSHPVDAVVAQVAAEVLSPVPVADPFEAIYPRIRAAEEVARRYDRPIVDAARAGRWDEVISFLQESDRLEEFVLGRILLAAASANRLDVVRVLKAKGLSSEIYRGKAVLNASEAGHIEVVDDLTRGKKPIMEMYKNPALYSAVKTRREGLVRTLVENTGPIEENILRELGDLACQLGDKQIFSFLQSQSGTIACDG